MSQNLTLVMMHRTKERQSHVTVYILPIKGHNEWVGKKSGILKRGKKNEGEKQKRKGKKEEKEGKRGKNGKRGKRRKKRGKRGIRETKRTKEGIVWKKRENIGKKKKKKGEKEVIS